VCALPGTIAFIDHIGRGRGLGIDIASPARAPGSRLFVP
jgi:hypothetical protein